MRPTRRTRRSNLQAVLWVAALLVSGSQSFAARARAQAPVEPSAIEDDSQAPARDAYVGGIAAFERAEYAAAAEQFAQADSLQSSPSAKLMLGRSLRQLGRLSEAHRSLRQVLAEAQAADDARYAMAAAAADLELAELQQELGWLSLRVSGDAHAGTLQLEGRSLEPSELQAPLPVNPGRVTLQLASADGVVTDREVEITAGRETTLAIIWPEPAPPVQVAVPSARSAVPRPATPPARASQSANLRNLGYSVGVVGMAGLVGFGVLGVLSAADFAELDRGCPKRTQCDPRFADRAARGSAMQTAANVSLVVGALAVAAGVSLFVIGHEEEQASLAVTPQSIQVQGAF